MATNSTPDHAIAQNQAPPQRPSDYTPNGTGQGPQVISTSGQLEVRCGPLLNYKRMSKSTGATATNWHGSVLIVTKPGQTSPDLHLRCIGPTNNGSTNGIAANGKVKSSPKRLQKLTNRIKGSTDLSQPRKFRGEKLYEDPRNAFWRFSIDLPLQDFEARWEYHIPNLHHLSGREEASTHMFFVPSVTQSMRIMFHSCNGFSVGTDVDDWSGCALWNDALRQHKEMPIHVMIGGGDQIYNDGVRVSGPLRPWTDISNPKKRRDFPFDEKLRAECDEFYVQNYISWYTTAPFANANSIIPQLNIWDDHDIIDGFGSYTDHFMKCPVFRGIGGVAYKYYSLFQHHVPPPKSTFTTDAPHGGSFGNRVPTDLHQLEDSYVMTELPEPCYIFGKTAGPYVEEKSRSVYCQLGAHIAFLGIDARTERTRHRINYAETYDLIFSRVSDELRAANGQIKHLILLLGVPIAYPRLQWLENILTSPIIGPIRLANKRFGIAGGLFNKFDGGVDILDDLDDHYTSHAHKKERKELVERLQVVSKNHSVRITILGGDVHLCALGRFYSNPRLGIETPNDWRYMSNIVSSAITNKPPPEAVANLLARRNKIHHLDHQTDETLLNVFDLNPGEKADPGVEKKRAASNRSTMPSRNYALLTESHEHPAQAASQGMNGTYSNGNTNGHASGANGHHQNGMPDPAAADDDANAAPADTGMKQVPHHNAPQHPLKKGNPREPLNSAEVGCGTGHPAASGLGRTGRGGPYGLDVAFRVEINRHDPEGKTEGYGFSIPSLTVLADTKSS